MNKEAIMKAVKDLAAKALQTGSITVDDITAELGGSSSAVMQEVSAIYHLLVQQKVQVVDDGRVAAYDKEHGSNLLSVGLGLLGKLKK